MLDVVRLQRQQDGEGVRAKVPGAAGSYPHQVNEEMQHQMDSHRAQNQVLSQNQDRPSNVGGLTIDDIRADPSQQDLVRLQMDGFRQRIPSLSSAPNAELHPASASMSAPTANQPDPQDDPPVPQNGPPSTLTPQDVVSGTPYPGYQIPQGSQVVPPHGDGSAPPQGLHPPVQKPSQQQHVAMQQSFQIPVPGQLDHQGFQSVQNIQQPSFPPQQHGNQTLQGSQPL